MSNPPCSARAYESLLAEMLAIPDDQIAGARLDVTAAITAVARLVSSCKPTTTQSAPTNLPRSRCLRCAPMIERWP